MTRSITAAILASCLLLAVAFAADGQISRPSTQPTPTPPAQTNQGQTNRVPPPMPPATDNLGMTVFLYYAVIVLLGGAVIAVSVMPGKRGHQD